MKKIILCLSLMTTICGIVFNLPICLIIGAVIDKYMDLLKV